VKPARRERVSPGREFWETNMTEAHAPRLFAADRAVRHIGEGLLARTLAREEWTHEAHLAACTWILVERPDIVPERDLPALIRRFNESVGGINDQTQGYHETITQCFIRGVRRHLARVGEAPGLAEKVNGLLLSPEGRRDWPLYFYTPERLFSVEARMGFVAPDLEEFPPTETDCEG
jgi:hypothetical protein